MAKKAAAPVKKKSKPVAKRKPAAPKKKVAAKKAPAPKKKAAAKKKPPAPPKKVAPKKKPAAAKPKAKAKPKAAPVRKADAARDAFLLDTGLRRAAAWGTWGDVHPDVITHLLNPALMGGPRWPAMRQAYRVVRRGGETLLASDGLSDPFDPGEGPQDRNGHGLEVYAVSPERIEPVTPSWLFDLVWNAAQLAAGRGDLTSLLDELGPISTELYDVRIPDDHADRFVNEAGRVGALIGVEDPSLPSRVDGPLSPIRLVNVVLLTRDELEYVLEHGDDGRAELARRLTEVTAPLRSSLHRPSVV
jgi:hypothetical protein